MKRLAPGETDTWFIEILGTDGGIRYSTKEPKTLWIFERGRELLVSTFAVTRFGLETRFNVFAIRLQ